MRLHLFPTRANENQSNLIAIEMAATRLCLSRGFVERLIRIGDLAVTRLGYGARRATTGQPPAPEQQIGYQMRDNIRIVADHAKC